MEPGQISASVYNLMLVKQYIHLFRMLIIVDVMGTSRRPCYDDCIVLYSLFQKKRTFNSEFFVALRGGGGPKIHMVDYVNVSSIHAQFFSLENLQPF